MSCAGHLFRSETRKNKPAELTLFHKNWLFKIKQIKFQRKSPYCWPDLVSFRLYLLIFVLYDFLKIWIFPKRRNLPLNVGICDNIILFQAQIVINFVLNILNFEFVVEMVRNCLRKDLSFFKLQLEEMLAKLEGKSMEFTLYLRWDDLESFFTSKSESISCSILLGFFLILYFKCLSWDIIFKWKNGEG